MFGVLVVCVGLAGSNEANDNFNHDVIVHGYARGSERAVRASNMHIATRFATAHGGRGRRIGQCGG